MNDSYLKYSMSEYGPDSLMKSYFPVTHPTDGRLPTAVEDNLFVDNLSFWEVALELLLAIAEYIFGLRFGDEVGRLRFTLANIPTWAL